MSKKLTNGQMFLAGLVILIVGTVIYHYDTGNVSLAISFATEVVGLLIVGLSIFRSIKNTFRHEDIKKENIEYQKEKIVPINTVRSVSNKSTEGINADKIMKILAGLALIIIAISFLYYLVARPIIKESRLDSCIKKAEDMKVGFPDHRYDDASEEAKKECYKRYK